MIVEHPLHGGPGGTAQQAELADDEQRQQRRHHRPFGIMEELAIADRALRIGGRPETVAGAGYQIVHDRASLDQAMTVDLHHRGAAERVNGAQRGGRAHGLSIAFVAADVIGFAQFLQQPEDALRPAVVQMMDDDGHDASQAACR